VHIAYNPVGKGTRLLTSAAPGDLIAVLMPMGNGFRIMPEMKKIWLVGGGIGCAPLKSVFDKYPDREYKSFLGFRSKDCIYQEDEFRAHSEAFISTDDGSYGECAFCTQLLERELQKDSRT
jgi:dihydroorotate dehydrogenase electron transfer subunit